MVGVEKLIFLYFAITSIRTVSLISIQELPKNDIIIDVTKGYALRRIGIYSPNVGKQIVHTFVPLSNFCMASPTTDVCLYTSLSERPNMVELATLTAPDQLIHAASMSNSDNVSKLIGDDVIRVLAQHREITRNNQSIVHLIDNQFHYQKTTQKALTTATLTNVNSNYDSVIYLRRPTPIEIILRQINNNKIGFEYLSSTDLKLFLTAIFSTIDTSYRVRDIQESLVTFVSLILGQSIFALRYCSFNQHNSVASQPCLAISTLFLRAPIHSTSIFSIFHLIPLSTVFNGDRYMYSNLPKIVGINPVNRQLIMWNDESDIDQCTFLPAVQCRRTPISMPISKSSCLSQLFDDSHLLTSTCQVSRSPNIDQGVVNIANNIWLFNNVHQIQHCYIYSPENELIETITINEGAVVSIPCNKRVACIDLQLSTSSCSQSRNVLISGFTSNISNLFHFIMPIKNITNTLLSTYNSQFDRSMKELFTTFTSKQPRFKRMMNDFASYILSVFFFILSIMLIYIFKLVRYKIQSELNNLESFVFQTLRV